jgi:hypothetical protein
MNRRRFAALLTAVALVSAAFGGATLAQAGSTKKATAQKRAQKHATTTRKARSHKATRASATQSEPAEAPGAEQESATEAPGNDGPGGHADEPGNASADHQFQGQE